MIELRDYQLAAVNAALHSKKHGIIVLPTGSGKSLVAAEIMNQYIRSLVPDKINRPLLISHRKELLVQDEAALQSVNEHIKTGIYCAGLDRKEPDAPIVFASIASVYKNPEILGERNPIIIDECHLIPRSANTMYGKVLNGHFRGSRRIGLSATPYRLDSGLLTEGDDSLFDEILIQISAKSLVDAGHLAPLVGIGADLGYVDAVNVHKRAGDFITGELEQVAMNEDLIGSAVQEIKKYGGDRKAHLVFCISIAHALAVSDEMQRQGMPTLGVWGDMHPYARDSAIKALKRGEIKALTNVDVLTTGIDIPSIDCISLLRPTMSKARHVQSLGRGMRIADGKMDCKIIDFSGNCARHGDIDGIGMLNFADLRMDRIQKERKKQAREAQKRVLSHGLTADMLVDPMYGGGTQELIVDKVTYETWNARRFPGKKNLVATYHTSEGKVRSWVCVEYERGARWHALNWFARRGVLKEDVPKSAEGARKLAKNLEEPSSLSVRCNDRGYLEVLVEHFESDANGEEQID